MNNLLIVNLQKNCLINEKRASVLCKNNTCLHLVYLTTTFLHKILSAGALHFAVYNIILRFKQNLSTCLRIGNNGLKLLLKNVFFWVVCK